MALLQRPELLGAQFMKEFPVQYPNNTAKAVAEVTSAASPMKAPSALEAPPEWQYR